MDSAFISVIIPVLNRDFAIKRAVESVLNQSFQDFECIVVNDGSTDGTLDVLSEFSDKITVVSTENRGVSAARNLGVRLSRGEYVAFLDSDDEWKPKKLEKQYNYMKNQGVRISQTEEIWVRNGKIVNKPLRYRKQIGYIFYQSLELCAVTPSSVLVEKKLFCEYGGFNENFPVCEDYDLWLRMSVKEKFGLVDEPLIVKYGGNSDQLSNTPAMDKYRIISIFNMLHGNVQLSCDEKSALAAMLEKKVGIYAEGALKRGKTDEYDWAKGLLK